MAPFIRAVLALAILAAAPPRLAAAAEFVDPNAQTEGVGASLNGAKLGQSNPLNLTAVRTVETWPPPLCTGCVATAAADVLRMCWACRHPRVAALWAARRLPTAQAATVIRILQQVPKRCIPRLPRHFPALQATVIGDQKDPPNAGFTLISPVGTDSKIFDPEMWSYE